VALGQVFSEYFGFPCQFSFHRLLHIHDLSSGAGTVGQLAADVPSIPQPKKLNYSMFWRVVRNKEECLCLCIILLSFIVGRLRGRRVLVSEPDGSGRLLQPSYTLQSRNKVLSPGIQLWIPWASRGKICLMTALFMTVSFLQEFGSVQGHVKRISGFFGLLTKMKILT
jgi:hypothetical protein